MTRRTVVFIAYYFPPLVGIASERAQSLTENLRLLGWHPVVVTVADGHFHRVTEQREYQFPVLRTRSFELSRVLRRGYALTSGSPKPIETSTVRPIPTGRGGSQLRSMAREFLYIPDAQAGWIPFAARAARRAVRFDRDTVVLSTSVPYSAHLAAMRVAARAGIGWVAEFRDPWSTAHPFIRPTRAVRRRIDRALERRIVQRADHVIVTSQSTRDQLLATHRELPARRISAVTNGFVAAAAGRPPSAREPLQIVYAGTVANGERTEDLLHALERVGQRDPGAFELRVLGPADPWLSGGARGVPPWLKLEGVVSPQAAREAMLCSSALLLIQRHDAYRSVLPGKAFEYIGARRPLIATVQSGSELARLLSAHADVRFVAPDRPDQLEMAVTALIAEQRAGELAQPRVAREVTAPLERARQAQHLSEILERVASDRRP